MRRARIVLAVVVAAAACQSTPYREVEVDLGAEAPGSPTEAGERKTLRFSVAAMQSARDTYAAYSPLVARMSHLLGVEIELVQRRTYREVNDLLIAGELDLAFVCTGAWLDLAERAPDAAELMAIPVIGGQTTYNAIVIVPSASPATRFEDLRGKRFAFTDDLSLTGHLYPTHLVRRLGDRPATFFSSTLFTRSHDRSVRAVARGLVDGASVDALIYDDLVADDPTLAGATRLVYRSQPLGMPPIVVSPRLPAELKQRLLDMLLGLADDPEAAAALEQLRIDRFVRAAPESYASARSVLEELRMP